MCPQVVVAIRPGRQITSLKSPNGGMGEVATVTPDSIALNLIDRMLHALRLLKAKLAAYWVE